MGEEFVVKVVLSPIGSHGDVFPMIMLGKTIRSLGHEVIFCAPPDSEEFIARRGFDFYSSGVDMKIGLNEFAVYEKESLINNIKLQSKFFQKLVTAQFSALYEVGRHADFIIGTGLQFAGRSVAEKLKIPYCHIMHFPQALSSGYYPPVAVPWQHLPCIINKIMWWGYRGIMNKIFKDTINLHRHSMSLEEIHDVLDYYTNTERIIIPADSSLAPIPSDVYVKYIQTGYWHPDEEEDIDSDVLEFLESGPPPVYIGFGSMPNYAPERINKILLDIIERFNGRVIILKGWASLEQNISDKDVKFIEYAPFLKLFPRMAAVVHHGGAGTVHAAARSGVPQVIIPHTADQYYWGERIYRLKLGPKAIPLPKITSKNFISAITEAVTNTQIKENTFRKGEYLRKQNGMQEALKYFSKWFVEG